MRYIVAIPLKDKKGAKFVLVLANSALAAKLAIEDGRYTYIGIVDNIPVTDQMQIVGELNG